MASNYGNTPMPNNLPPSYEEVMNTAPTHVPNASNPPYAATHYPTAPTAPYPSATPYSHPISTTCKPVPTAPYPTAPYPVSPFFPVPTTLQGSSTVTSAQISTPAPTVVVQQPRQQDGTSPCTRCVLVLVGGIIISVVMYLIKVLIFSSV
ncbi:hypothetical protein E2C01_094436 [Portunus trituberculatus]|uniref:Uncharacterized protein n=1 Tax=Portunus trituberculatus TaxID=210409 RepID=A0A5B7JSF7_PORTR|nr:hypothetical protein [Portunus trituberculatus]